MKMLKKLIVPVLLVALLATSLLLTSCKQECVHEFGEWTVTKEVSCTENGEMTRTCSLCGEVETSVTAATGHESDNLVCGKCNTALVGIDSLFPTVSEDVKSVGIVLSEVKLASVVDDQPLTLKLAELVFYLDEDGAPAVYGEGAAKIGDEAEADNASYFVFSEGDMIYVELTSPEDGTRYVEASLSELMLSNPEASNALEMVNTLLPAIEKWVNDSLLPVFTTPDLPVEMPELTEDRLLLAASKVIDLFFDAKTTDNGTVITLDLSIVKDANNALNEKTVAELIDAIGGEGSFLKLQAMVPTVLGFSGEDLVKFLSLNLGMDIPAFLDALDELAVIITGMDGATLEMLLQIEGDIGAILESEEFLKTSVKDLLMASMELTTEDALNAAIEEIFLTLKTNTVYQLLKVDPEIPAQINGIVDMITEAVKLEITVEGDGKFAGTSLSVTLPEQNLYVTATVNVKGEFEINLNDGEGTNNIDLGIYPGYEVKKDAEKMAALKAQFTGMPEINAEIIGKTYLYPVIIDGELVNAVTVYNSYFLEHNGVNSLVVEVTEGDIFNPLVRIVGEKCANRRLYGYEIAVVNSYRYYPVDEAVSSDPDVDTFELAYELINSNAEYTVEYSYNSTYSFDFCYSEDGEVYSSYDLHSLETDYENSVFEEDVACGETYFEIERCVDCGYEKIYSDVKEHDSDVTKVSYDEELGVVYGDVYCKCGELIANNRFSILPNEMNIQPKVYEEYREYPDFSYTITEAGTYRFYVSDFDSDESGYSHIYLNGYVGTLYFSENQTGYVDLYLEPGEGYFTILYYEPDADLNISIGIEKIG